MLNPFTETNWNPDRAERRKFARSLIIGFPVIALLFAIIGRVGTHAWKPFFLWLGIIGLAVGVVLWLIPHIARPFYVVWYFVACSMGLIVGNVLLGGFYYLVLTPIGLLMRLKGHDPLKIRFDRTTSTYWNDVEKVIDLTRYYRQF